MSEITATGHAADMPELTKMTQRKHARFASSACPTYLSNHRDKADFALRGSKSENARNRTQARQTTLIALLLSSPPD
jgi:hypothetical protein